MTPIASVSPTSADRSLCRLTTGNDGACSMHPSAAGQDPLSFPRAYSTSLLGPEFTCQRSARPVAPRLHRCPLHRQRQPIPHTAR
jgi:hypothetical protein